MLYYVSLVDCLMILLLLCNSTGAMAGQGLGKATEDQLNDGGIVSTSPGSAVWWTPPGSSDMVPNHLELLLDLPSTGQPIQTGGLNVANTMGRVYSQLLGDEDEDYSCEHLRSVPIESGVGGARQYVPIQVEKAAGGNSDKSIFPFRTALTSTEDKKKDAIQNKAAGGNSDKSIFPFRTALTSTEDKKKDAIQNPSFDTGGFNVVKTMARVHQRLLDDDLGSAPMESGIVGADDVICEVNTFFTHTAIIHCCCIWPPNAFLNYLTGKLLDDVGKFLDLPQTTVRDQDIVGHLRNWSNLTFLWSKGPQDPLPSTIGLADDEDLKYMFLLRSRFKALRGVTDAERVLPTVPDMDLQGDIGKLVHTVLREARMERTMKKKAAGGNSDKSIFPFRTALTSTEDKKKDAIQNLLSGRLSTAQPIQTIHIMQTVGVNAKTGGFNVVNTMGRVYSQLLGDEDEDYSSEHLRSVTIESGVGGKKRYRASVSVKQFFEHTAIRHCCYIWPPRPRLNFFTDRILNDISTLLDQDRTIARDQQIIFVLRAWRELTELWPNNRETAVALITSFSDADEYWFFQLKCLDMILRFKCLYPNSLCLLPTVPDMYQEATTQQLVNAMLPQLGSPV
eukprot:GHVQ01016798.1.p1 GENE.GHVQ01016798.1~~GHVQ01016798.1.p1  ORF type:complete len:619 (-),score=50.85 GHVQ01016798.1:228-2084(-)